ncbi:MAG TPA: TetR/AcrR family transcriptional regulator [Pseudonocardia sp.]|jgi:AcrR family transcriptional regulator
MQRKRAHTREHVLEVAERLRTGSERGLPRMEDLADAADVSVGLIYDHFGSKDGLDLALAERALAGLADYLAHAGDYDCSPLQRVIIVGEFYLRWILDHPSVLRSVVLQGVDGQPAQADQLQQIDQRLGGPLEEILRRFQDRIEQAIAAGEADPTLDPRLTARFLWAAWNGVAALSARADRMAFSEAEVAQCLRLGRRVVNEGLTNPSFRNEVGRSRAALVHP